MLHTDGSNDNKEEFILTYNKEAASEAFFECIAYWAPEWSANPDMVDKMIYDVIYAAMENE